jgi:APA family basic amino acid/polyamine antiporter
MPGYDWLATAVTVAILAGFSSVILVMFIRTEPGILLNVSRWFFYREHSPIFHKKFRTPFKSNWILFLFVGGLATLLPGDITGDLTSIGTLFAFVLVCIGVWIMRVKQPVCPRPLEFHWFQ